MTYGVLLVLVLGTAADWPPLSRSGATSRDPSAGGIVKGYTNEGRNESEACKKMVDFKEKRTCPRNGKAFTFKSSSALSESHCACEISQKGRQLPSLTEVLAAL
tara:strand:- start:568 stop:879 length:312 start_codon:yes stop_codon:yes gene_type:complete